MSWWTREGIAHRRRAVASFNHLWILDNGSEFRSRVLDAWAYEHQVVLDFIAPGKRVQNAVVESYNGRMRDELLNTRWWRQVNEAREAINLHREDYNAVRPHSALGQRTPREFDGDFQQAGT